MKRAAVMVDIVSSPPRSSLDSPVLVLARSAAVQTVWLLFGRAGLVTTPLIHHHGVVLVLATPPR